VTAGRKFTIKPMNLLNKLRGVPNMHRLISLSLLMWD
jgi:hypothetical protein